MIMKQTAQITAMHWSEMEIHNYDFRMANHNIYEFIVCITKQTSLHAFPSFATPRGVLDVKAFPFLVGHQGSCLAWKVTRHRN